MTNDPTNWHIPAPDSSRIFARLSADDAGWETLNLVGLHIPAGETFALTVENYEYIAVILGGVCDVRTSRGDFEHIGRRPDVFTGLPYSLIIPPQTEVEFQSLSDDFAVLSVWCPTSDTSPNRSTRLIRPHEVKTSIVGNGRDSYQRNAIISNAVHTQHLFIEELYTPSGNWTFNPPVSSSYDRLCFQKFDRPQGYAIHRLYDDGNYEEAIIAHHNDLVIVPKGHHQFVSGSGFATYTLMVSAGDHNQKLITPDARYNWMTQRVHGNDPRLPIVDLGMEPYEDRS